MEDSARKILGDSISGDERVGRQRGGWPVSSSFTLLEDARSEMLVRGRGNVPHCFSPRDANGYP